MDCFSSIFSPSFQDFYTIVLDELVLEVVAHHRDDIPSGSGYFPLIRHTQQLGTTRLFPAPK
jgi:hypothetical protein